MPGFFALVLLLLSLGSTTFAKGEYLTDQEFFALAFPDTTNLKQSFFWLDRESKQQIKDIIGHDYQGLRIRYWHLDGERTAWILNEIGKVKPITMGFVVENGAIVRMDVLAFREVRGYEVRYPFFTKQLKNLSLDENLRLTGDIDNITGATMSVNAVRKTARLALWLASQI